MHDDHVQCLRFNLSQLLSAIGMQLETKGAMYVSHVCITQFNITTNLTKNMRVLIPHSQEKIAIPPLDTTNDHRA